jgi:hypothetical protein
VKDNQLNVFDKNGTIYIEWDVNKRSNPDDEWFDDMDQEDEDLWYSHEDAMFDIFEWGLVMQMLVTNIEDKTPEEFKKYFYNQETLKTEDPESPMSDRYLGRLKIFERNGWETKKELLRKAKHMRDFYILWNDFKFGDWKFEAKLPVGDDLFPFKILFEWKYPDFFVFEEFDTDDCIEEESLYYICAHIYPAGFAPHIKFCYLVPDDIEGYETSVQASEKRKKKLEKKKPKVETKTKEDEWIEKQKKQSDLF